MEHLVRFIVADDQVCHYNCIFSRFHTSSKLVRVVECPEFRQLCLLLRESLKDGDIPHRDKMRESILSQWRESFEGLKLELSVS